VTESDDGTVSAVSRDGRTFSFSHGGGFRVLVGDVVLLVPDGAEPLLGQVLEQSAGLRSDAPITCDGLLLGALRADGVERRFERRPFTSASVERATAEHLESLQRSSGPGLPIGTWNSGGVEVAARVRAQGFGRHSFLCGQSGSGKTYALGVILEQILLGTDLRMVVMDPNADFVRLGSPRPDAPSEQGDRMGAAGVRVLGAGSTGLEPLRLRFATMPVAARAAVLRLDPLTDRGEYNHFLHMMEDPELREVGDVVRRLRSADDDGRALAQRLENLGLNHWEVWAHDDASAFEVLEGGARATVLNLSGFHDPREPLAVSLDLIEQLWAHREGRTPTLIVLDEAHNLCPAQPVGSLQRALVERLIQIAAEGRKYGLWLLLSTQRPSKIHPQVLSQCDNLALMRMNSPGDLAELEQLFGFVPPEMLRLAPMFRKGESLMSGAFAPAPTFVQVRRRRTQEGGGDLRVPTPAR
jgi:DNA helicase HerA-like ATPase